MARGMGVTAAVTSPTYTIVNEYEGRIPLIHCDMYRISSADELFMLGWDEYIQRAAVVVEWSENIAGALPPDAIRITLMRLSDTAREITIERPSGEGWI